MHYILIGIAIAFRYCKFQKKHFATMTRKFYFHTFAHEKLMWATIWHDFKLPPAVDAMDMPFLNAYLDSVGAPNLRAGVNFAQAGCSITPATATSVSPFSFGLQIKQFFAFKDKVTKLLSKGMARFSIRHIFRCCGYKAKWKMSSAVCTHKSHANRMNFDWRWQFCVT